ncbi:MAG: MtrB/PioB family decaheme-associated outer membrane protein [Bacteroidota bacterium]
MRVREEEIKISLVCAAVLGALAALSAAPAFAADTSDDEMAAIRRPENYVEIGAVNVDQASAKFGEYNGLNKDRVEGIANFGIKGGDAYEGGDGTMRWGVSGSNLGTTSREFDATVGNQGKWNVGIGYDELRHNLSDTYQTPYQGSMGGNSFVLPAGFGAVSTSAPGTNGLTPGQQAAFHKVDIDSTRRNTFANASLNLAPHWDVKLEYNHLDQSGAKLMGFGSQLLGGASTGEKVAILANPTNYQTDTVNLSLNWAGEKAHMTTSYFGSFFRDGYDRVTWTNFVGTNAVNTMTTPPGNDFHQFNLAGGYNLAAKTKLAGGLSYSRNTQNDPFVDSGLMVTPASVSSLNGLVVNTHADLKLTDQTFKDLALSAGIKYDKRDNRTPSNIYNFNAISGSAGNIANYPNTPLSTKKTQLELAADYRLDKSQNVRLALNHDDTDRWCNNYAVLSTRTQVSPLPAGVLGYPAGTNCVVAKESREDKATLSYRLKASQNLNLNAAYAYGERRTDFDPLARTAMIGTNGGIVTGNPLGQNAGDFLGFHPYLDENRNQQMLKVGANWQANDQFSLGFNAKYTDDVYDTQYGWKNGHQWSVNLDASYNYRETGIVSAYVTQQSRYRKRTDLRNLNTSTAAGPNTLSFPQYSTNTGTLTDDDFTVGLSFKEAGLLKGKLELVGDLSYSLGKTDYGTTLNYVALTSGGLTCDSAAFLICGNTPTVKNALTQFKLTGAYQVDKASKVALGYLYQHLQSNDYFYNGLQTGSTPTGLLPTNQQSPNYRVNLLMASYIYTF